jgi:hypothetical protein
MSSLDWLIGIGLGSKWSCDGPSLVDVISQGPVQERDRIMMAMLKSLGIEKVQPLKPNERRNSRRRSADRRGHGEGELVRQAL